MSQNWNPLQDLITLQDRMNRLFEDTTQSGYQIAIDLPGVNRDAVEIDLDESRLVVKGTRTVDESIKHRTERPSGKFLRAFTVPGSVDQTQIGAEYKDGVLQLRLPKRTEPKPQKEIG